MGYDWIPIEAALEVFSIDGDAGVTRFNALVDAGEIEYITRTHGKGSIYLYSLSHIDRHFSVRDRSARRRLTTFLKIGGGAALVAAVERGVNDGIDLVTEFLRGLRHPATDENADPRNIRMEGLNAYPDSLRHNEAPVLQRILAGQPITYAEAIRVLNSLKDAGYRPLPTLIRLVD